MKLLARFKAWRRARRERWAAERANAEVRAATENYRRDTNVSGFGGDGPQSGY